MAPRTFEVEGDPGLPDGFWPGDAIEVDNRSELERLMLDAATVLDRIGGTFSIAAIRQELPDANGNPSGLFVPFRYRAKWESFAPGIRVPVQAVQETPAPPPAPEPDPDLPGPDPEAAAPQEDAEEEVPQVDLFDDDFGPDAEAALAAQAEQG